MLPPDSTAVTRPIRSAASIGSSGHGLASPWNCSRLTVLRRYRWTTTVASGRQNAQIWPRRGRRAPATRTRAPAGIAGAIEGPSTSIQRGRADTSRRRTAATAPPRPEGLDWGRSLARDDEYGRGLMRRVISVAGVAVSLEADDTARWQALDALFGLCPTAASSDGVLRLCFSASPPPAPGRPPDVAFSDVELWYTDAGVVTRHRDGIVVAATATRSSPAARLPPTGSAKAFRRAVQHVLADAMAAHGRFALHGAVIVDGTGAIIVLGDAGAGKSTLAISALRLGWSVVTDDIAWVAAAGDGSLTIVRLPEAAPRPAGDPRRAAGRRRSGRRRSAGAVRAAHGRLGRRRRPSRPRHRHRAPRRGRRHARAVPHGTAAADDGDALVPVAGLTDAGPAVLPASPLGSATPRPSLMEHAKDPAVRGAEAAALLRDAEARLRRAGSVVAERPGTAGGGDGAGEHHSDAGTSTTVNPASTARSGATSRHPPLPSRASRRPLMP